MSEDYDKRKKAGKVAIMVWVDEDIGLELDALMAAGSHTKTRVVEDAIALLAEVGRKRAAGAKDAALLRKAAPELVRAVRAELERDFPRPRTLRAAEEEDEEGEAPAQARARQVTPEGSPGEIAARVRANGARRSGTVVATGQRSENGRIRRD